MAVINPYQVSHLIQNQVDFGFSDRTKAYAISGKFEPFLAGPNSLHNETEITSSNCSVSTAPVGPSGASAEEGSEGKLRAHPAARGGMEIAAVQKKSVYTSTREMFDLEEQKPPKTKQEEDRLERLGWILERFFAKKEDDPVKENDELGSDMAIYSAEESQEKDSVPRITYQIQASQTSNVMLPMLELLRSMLLFLQDGSIQINEFFLIQCSLALLIALCRMHLWTEYY